MKGLKEKVIHNIKKTHRGPLFSFDSLQLNSMMLFGKMIASLRTPAHFSFAWQGQFEGEYSYSVIRKMYEAKTIEDIFDDIEDFEDKYDDSYAGAS